MFSDVFSTSSLNLCCSELAFPRMTSYGIFKDFLGLMRTLIQSFKNVFTRNDAN